MEWFVLWFSQFTRFSAFLNIFYWTKFTGECKTLVILIKMVADTIELDGATTRWLLCKPTEYARTGKLVSPDS